MLRRQAALRYGRPLTGWPHSAIVLAAPSTRYNGTRSGPSLPPSSDHGGAAAPGLVTRNRLRARPPCTRWLVLQPMLHVARDLGLAVLCLTRPPLLAPPGRTALSLCRLERRAPGMLLPFPPPLLACWALLVARRPATNKHMWRGRPGAHTHPLHAIIRHC